ncbi:putative G-protein coupled receptor 132 [Merluccius polli]|uniref:G-protein coupled receptor 132 n=1 Tax=Merluccius polli TaxID=89951 RepID=A0AA47MPW9_MERPO|nr:putative G-protein coupled receptor 132 [Merluccius polli]
MLAEGMTGPNGSSPNGSSLSPCNLPYENMRLPLVILYSVVALVGVPANILTAWLTWGQVLRKNVLGVYLWSLSVCDLTYLATLPLWAIYFSKGHKWLWGTVACQLTGFIFFTNMYISILLLCCISCDRYVAVKYALEFRSLRRRRIAVGVTVTAVAVVTAAHVPIFLIHENDGEHTKGRCFEPDHTPSKTVTGFNYARFLLGFLAPLVLLAMSNRGILRGVRASHSLQPCQKRRVRVMVVAVVTVFLVCFAPYHLILLVRATFPYLSLEKWACSFSLWIQMPYNVSLGLSTLNSACNPLLYVLSSEDVRRELSLSLRCCGAPTTPTDTSMQPPLRAAGADPQGPQNYRSLKDEVLSETREEELLRCLSSSRNVQSVPVGVLEQDDL